MQCWEWKEATESTLTPKIHSICIVHQHSASVGDDGEGLGAKVSRDRGRQMREQMRFQIRGPLVLFASLGFDPISVRNIKFYLVRATKYTFKNFRLSWNEAKCNKERTSCIFLDHGDEEFGF